MTRADIAKIKVAPSESLPGGEEDTPTGTLEFIDRGGVPADGVVLVTGSYTPSGV